MNLKDLKKELPPLIARSRVETYFPGIVASGTLANLASRGRGPRFIRRGRKVFYFRDDLLKWIFDEALPLNTVNQTWKEDL